MGKMLTHQICIRSWFMVVLSEKDRLKKRNRNT